MLEEDISAEPVSELSLKDTFTDPKISRNLCPAYSVELVLIPRKHQITFEGFLALRYIHSIKY